MDKARICGIGGSLRNGSCGCSARPDGASAWQGKPAALMEALAKRARHAPAQQVCTG